MVDLFDEGWALHYVFVKKFDVGWCTRVWEFCAPVLGDVVRRLRLLRGTRPAADTDTDTDTYTDTDTDSDTDTDTDTDTDIDTDTDTDTNTKMQMQKQMLPLIHL